MVGMFIDQGSAVGGYSVGNPEVGSTINDYSGCIRFVLRIDNHRRLGFQKNR